MREVSLDALIQELDCQADAGEPTPPEILHLAGLVKIEYVILIASGRTLSLRALRKDGSWTGMGDR
ncbi:MAG: hypothetical protein U1D30_04795 [Planctomycetota bacterium]